MSRFSLIWVTGFSCLACLGAPASEAGKGQSLLGRAGGRVEQFWNDFSAVTCTETVVQTKYAPNGKTILERKSAYDYLILMTWAGDELNVTESRVLQAKKEKETERPLLVTQGFATLLLILHPNFQSSYEFTLLPEEQWQGRRMQRLQFRHLEGARSPSALELRGRDFPIEWEGSVWIDPQTFVVTRLQAGLKAPMEDLGLRYLTADVQYQLASLPGATSPMYVPVEAVIEAKTLKQHWKNLHRFSKYRTFSVDTKVKIEEPQH
jgi:hypothetical protein